MNYIKLNGNQKINSKKTNNKPIDIMGIVQFQLKTHSREDITNLFELNDCIVHNCKPTILKIVAGKRKEIHYVAVCKDEQCGKITMEENNIDKIWNKWNNLKQLPSSNDQSRTNSSL